MLSSDCRVIVAVGLFASCLSSPANADTCDVQVVCTKGGFILGAGRGDGVLLLRGASVRVPRLRLERWIQRRRIGCPAVGTCHEPASASDIHGTYSLIGAGAALAASGGNVPLRNQRGVVLQLAGAKLCLELSVALGGVTITFR